MGRDRFTSGEGRISSRAMDPRIDRTRRTVRRAALAVLGARGYAAFTMEAVAETAGVSKSTLYRHWPTKLALIADALETLNEQPAPSAETGESAHEQIRGLLRHLSDAFAGSTLSACIPALVEAAERHDEVARFLHDYNSRRRRALVETIKKGVASGELSSALDPDLAALALIGPILYRRLMTPKPMDAEQAVRLVDLVLRSEVRCVSKD